MKRDLGLCSDLISSEGIELLGIDDSELKGVGYSKLDIRIKSNMSSDVERVLKRNIVSINCNQFISVDEETGIVCMDVTDLDAAHPIFESARMSEGYDSGDMFVKAYDFGRPNYICFKNIGAFEKIVKDIDFINKRNDGWTRIFNKDVERAKRIGGFKSEVSTFNRIFGTRKK